MTSVAFAGYSLPLQSGLKVNDMMVKLKETFPDRNKELIDVLNINTELWLIEDEIRVCEKNNDFGDNFIKLARSVYKTNDKRFHLKNDVNKLFNSNIKEQKSYKEY